MRTVAHCIVPFLVTVWVSSAELLPQANRSGHLLGAVVRSETGERLEGVQVFVQRDTYLPVLLPPVGVEPMSVGFRMATTDREGQFALDGLEPGNWMVTTHRAGFASAVGPVMVTIRSGAMRQIQLAVSQSPVITGRITDGKGKPRRGVIVSAYRHAFDVMGQRFPRYYATERSDDRGEFRFTSPEFGDHFIKFVTPSLATGEESAASVEAGFPGTPLDLARPISLTRAGEIYDLGEVALPESPGNMLSVSVTTDLRSSRLRTLNLVVSRFPHRTGVRSGQVPSLASRLLVGQVPAGRYVVEVRGVTVEGAAVRGVSDAIVTEQQGAPVHVEIRLREDAELTVAARLAPGSPSPDTPDPVAGITLQWMERNGDTGRRYSRNLRLGEDKPFFVAPGDYRLGRVTLPHNLYVEKVTMGRTDALREGFRVVDGQRQAIVVELNGPAATVRGTVMGEGGRIAAHSLVVLVPRDRTLLPYYFTALADDDGVFTMQAAPGAYELYAWKSVDTAAYLDSAFMTRFDGRGTSLMLDRDSMVSLSISTQE